MCWRAAASACRAKQRSCVPIPTSSRPTWAPDLPTDRTCKMTIHWQGVIPALMTEMKKDGALDLDATARHIESCLAAGCEGFVMLGTLGENSSLSPDEKELVVRTAVEAVGGRVPVIAGVAEYTTGLAIEAGNRAKAAGAAGLMALPT